MNFYWCNIRYQALRFLCQKKYLVLINAVVYQIIVGTMFEEAHSQQSVIALVRRECVKSTKKYISDLSVFTCMDNLILREKRTRADLERKLRQAQNPTMQAISEQVEEELDTQLMAKMNTTTSS